MSKKSRIIWLQAMRPKTWVATLSPVLIGTVCALHAGYFDLLLFLFTLITALGIQITTNLVNDYQDAIKGADSVGRKGPQRVTALGLLSVQKMQRAALLSTSMTLVTGSYLVFTGGYPLLLLLLVSLLLAYGYTTGPYPLAYLGLGEPFVFLFFGPIAVGVTYFLQTGEVALSPFLAGIAPGALSTAILTINNLRDREVDRLAHKKTLVVRFGAPFGRYVYLFSLSLGILTPLYFFSSHPFVLVTLLTACPAFFLVRALFEKQEESPLFSKTAALVPIYALLFCVGYLL